MEQTYSNPDAVGLIHNVLQKPADMECVDTPVDEQSSEGTANDENVKIEEGSDILQEAPEKEYYYHNYVLPEEYTNWVCDIGWPETDSDDEGVDIVMYDDYLHDINEYPSSSEEEDDGSPEPPNYGRPITESDVNELGYHAILALPSYEVAELPVIKSIIEGLNGLALFETAVRGLRSIPKQKRALYSSSYHEALTILNRTVGLENEDQVRLTWFDSDDDTNWDIILEALKVTQSTDDVLLRNIVTCTIKHAGWEEGANILWPSLYVLSSAQRQELTSQALEKLQSLKPPYSRCIQLPYHEDLELC